MTGFLALMGFSIVVGVVRGYLGDRKDGQS